MNKTLIERIEVGSGGAASLTFSSIPQTFLDLQLVLSLRTIYDNVTQWWDVDINFNGVSTNRTQKLLYGGGSGAAASLTESTINVRTNDSGTTANTFGSTSLYISNYTGSLSKVITMEAVSENNSTTAFASLAGGLWNSSDAITSITVIPQTNGLTEFSTAALYGITAGSDGTTTVS